jgi:hypothetical protein
VDASELLDESPQNFTGIASAFAGRLPEQSVEMTTAEQQILPKPIRVVESTPARAYPIMELMDSGFLSYVGVSWSSSKLEREIAIGASPTRADVPASRKMWIMWPGRSAIGSICEDSGLCAAAWILTDDGGGW